jgi:hypothetical protein
MRSPTRTPRFKYTLHLGVVSQPYDNRGKKGMVTTGDVAKILEANYGLFQHFYDANEKFVQAQFAGAAKVAVKAMLSGRAIDPSLIATAAIETRFRNFLASRQAERVGMSGVPTAAAKRGVNHRLVHPYLKSNPRRPSFVDTGLMMASFRAWVSRK